MLPSDHDRFLEAVCNAVKAGKGKLPLAPDSLDAWWNTLKRYPIKPVLEALDGHTNASKRAPTPDQIERRINGDTSAPDAKPQQPARDPRCTFEHNGTRCPAAAGCYELGALRARCTQHELHRADHARCVEILEELVAHGVPFVPGTPHRQRALFLWETQGESAVLAEFDARYVTWLRTQESLGHTAERSFNLPPRARSVAELAHRAIKPVDQETA